MKYFTKDWYEEMQVAGFLVLPETEEDWQEELDHYREEGKDLREINLSNLYDMRESLMRYLSETFHPYIHDGKLVTEYPTPELRMLVNRWERDYERRMEELGKQYQQHYESVKAELPPNAVELVENGLHTLFDSPMMETVIRACDVKIEPLKLPLMRRLQTWYRRR